MEDISNPAIDALESQLAKVDAALETIGKDDIRAMTEYVFTNVFLPLFAGEEDRKYPVTIDTWANYAGNYNRPVHIVKSQADRTILFTVPPLHDREGVRPAPFESTPISNVMISANQYARIHPIQGQMFLAKEFAKRSMVMKRPIEIMGKIKEWNEIFARYGKPQIDINALLPEGAEGVEDEPKELPKQVEYIPL